MFPELVTWLAGQNLRFLTPLRGCVRLHRREPQGEKNDTFDTYFLALASGLLVLPVLAADDEQTEWHHLPRVQLMDVLEAVHKKTGKSFVVDRSVDADIVVGLADPRKMDYETLLIVLRNNEMAAVEYRGATSIVDVDRVRQYPLPVIYAEDDAIADEEWVTMLIAVENAPATMFVPILRPMLPKQGHLVAHADSNMLTIVDRYANVRRVLQLIRKMDGATKPQ